MSLNLITILGPTAVGKTFLAAKLANRFNGEIISADSRQVYRRMDIGTGKDLNDYIVDGNSVPHHMLDIIEPKDEFNLFNFTENFYKSFNEIISRGKIPFLVGGTGLYLHSILGKYELKKVGFDKSRFEELNKLNESELISILKKINPALHNTTDLKIKERIIKAIMIAEKNVEQIGNAKPEINSLTIGIKVERDEVKKRITARLKKRLQSGMVEEVKLLIDSGITHERLEQFGLEYKFISRYLRKKLNYNDMFQKLNSAIHDFAKRQMTWFRKMEKEGITIYWINGANYEEASQIISENFTF